MNGSIRFPVIPERDARQDAARSISHRIDDGGDPLPTRAASVATSARPSAASNITSSTSGHESAILTSTVGYRADGRTSK